MRANGPSVLRLGLPVERRLRCAGKINFDSTSENIRQGITTNGICAKISPRLPSTINSGTKAMAVVVQVAVILQVVAFKMLRFLLSKG